MDAPIWVVSIDEDLREGLCHVLATDGYPVATFESEASALQMLEMHGPPPQLIFLVVGTFDLAMRVCDQAHGTGIHVALLDPFFKLSLQPRLIGADHYIVPPYTPDSIVDFARHVVSYRIRVNDVGLTPPPSPTP